MGGGDKGGYIISLKVSYGVRVTVKLFELCEKIVGDPVLGPSEEMED